MPRWKCSISAVVRSLSETWEGVVSRSWAVVTVELYTLPGDGLTISDYLANIVQDALEARQTPDKVYFRDVRVVDDGRDGGHQKVRVIANLDYDRVK
jgi:hypothetical protein